MCLALCLLTVLHHVLASSPLSHDKQRVFLHAFCKQQQCSSIVFFGITGVLHCELYIRVATWEGGGYILK
jgi:hypothetical protein